MSCRRCCVSTGSTSATEIFMQDLVCPAWDSKPEDPLPSAVIRSSNRQFMLSFLVISWYITYMVGIYPMAYLAVISVCLYILKQRIKENRVQVFTAKCQLPTGVCFFCFIESVLVIRSELSSCWAFWVILVFVSSFKYTRTQLEKVMSRAP